MTEEQYQIIKQAYNLLYEAGTKFPISSQTAHDRRNRAATLLKRILESQVSVPFNFSLHNTNSLSAG